MQHLKLIQLYNDGHITKMEMCHSIFQTITKDNAEQVWADVPEEVRQDMLDSLYLNPDRLRKRFCIEAVVFRNGFTMEDVKRRWEEEDRKYREGMVALREYLGILPI